MRLNFLGQIATTALHEFRANGSGQTSYFYLPTKTPTSAILHGFSSGLSARSLTPPARDTASLSSIITSRMGVHYILLTCRNRHQSAESLDLHDNDIEERLTIMLWHIFVDVV